MYVICLCWKQFCNCFKVMTYSYYFVTKLLWTALLFFCHWQWIHRADKTKMSPLLLIKLPQPLETSTTSIWEVISKAIFSDESNQNLTLVNPHNIKILNFDFNVHFWISKWSCYDVASQSACKIVLLWRHQPISLQKGHVDVISQSDCK